MSLGIWGVSSFKIISKLRKYNRDLLEFVELKKSKIIRFSYMWIECSFDSEHMIRVQESYGIGEIALHILILGFYNVLNVGKSSYDIGSKECKVA